MGQEYILDDDVFSRQGTYDDWLSLRGAHQY